jgi:hypothetical protein
VITSTGFWVVWSSAGGTAQVGALFTTRTARALVAIRVPSRNTRHQNTNIVRLTIPWVIRAP